MERNGCFLRSCANFHRLIPSLGELDLGANVTRFWKFNGLSNVFNFSFHCLLIGT